MTRFRYGVYSKGVPVWGSGVPTSFGNYYYVSSVTGSVDYPGTRYDRALPTLDAAINLTTANQDDVIIVLPNHAENITGAAGAALDVAGVTVYGMGHGTDRPQFTFTATASTIPVTAANVKIHNIHFINTVDALVVAIPVSAAHCRITNCLFDDATAAEQTNDYITLTAAADYFELYDCDHHGSDTAGAQSFITGAAADHVKIVNLQSHGDFAAANIEMTAAWTDCYIGYCKLENANAVDVGIEGFAAATGFLEYNSIEIATDAQVTGINTVGALALYENYQVNNDGETGLLIGVVSI